uniref:probable aspartyl protease At4g16563 n=1 Tax=Erigeron canadensis TaxID=72917 RepID=UPI001CB90B2E|nr:probable aspartyl protease At4g16563 [Erigeron canadensis]
MALNLISIFSLISLLLCFHSSASQNSLKLKLTPITTQPISTPESNNNNNNNNNQHPWMQTLSYLTKSSLARAHHLKNPKDNSSVFKSEIPLFPHSYGGYSVSLGFGSPSQELSFVMDTGSSLVWFPCTHRYSCSGCDFPNINESSIQKFIPKLSSSAKILGCTNKKCGLVFGSSSPVKCNGKEICPAYMLQYGSGSTSGLLLSETLNFKEGDVTDFVVGCSIISAGQPAGIAGFGRGPASLPVQMGLKKFSYCLVSHRFNDKPVSSEMTLVRGSSHSSTTDAGISYTKFRKNPSTSRPAFQEYYYVNLRKITVGGKTVRIPYGYLVSGSDGNGGTIIDSGTTFTFMDSHIHNLVAKEFESQMSKYKRASDVEKGTGLRPCFNISGKLTKFPELMFHFKGGAKLALPLADYFSFFGESDVLCMTLVSSDILGSGTRTGPSIIIGNFQQQNVYLEYDLENSRLGFKKQICK